MLKQAVYTPFSPRSCRPAGWLKRQLEIQAAGLNGHLDQMWPDIQSSRWIGGEKEGWERVPYWLDGFIPLAWLLGDEGMQARALRYVEAILEGQQEDCWICPCLEEEREGYDLWALFLICKVLVVYQDCTGDPRIEEAVYRALRQLQNHLDSRTLHNWGAARWFECLIPLFWLYERRPEEWMLDLAFQLEIQGFDYEKLFGYWRFERPYEKGRWSFVSHVVNLAMCLKYSALYARLTGQDGNAEAKRMIRLLLQDHGMAVGHFTGDECLSGSGPLQGSELCSVVEAMYSYEILFQLTGDPEWADRLEELAYNALPAATTPDMWAHQYDQMTNQIECSVFPEEEKPFRTNSGEAHLFGLEPHFGCCTANFGQGWPKLALSALLKKEGGFGIGAIAPCSAEGRVEGTAVRLELQTEYPFEDGYTLIVSPERPVELELDLRIPGKALSAALDGRPVSGPVFRLRRLFEKETRLEVRFQFAPEWVSRPSGMVCVKRGVLLYALGLEAEETRLEYVRDGVERKFPYCDYQFRPVSPWNYAFAGTALEFHRGRIGKFPFDPDCPPVWLTAQMVPIPWRRAGGCCAEYPDSLEPLGQPEEKRLIPYGCTSLRMTEMPLISGQREL